MISRHYLIQILQASKPSVKKSRGGFFFFLSFLLFYFQVRRERCGWETCQGWQGSGRTRTGTRAGSHPPQDLFPGGFPDLPEYKVHLRCTPKMQVLEAPPSGQSDSRPGVVSTSHLPQGSGPRPRLPEVGSEAEIRGRTLTRWGGGGRGDPQDPHLWERKCSDQTMKVFGGKYWKH